MRIQMLMKRVLMACLLCLALLVTFLKLSGFHLNDLRNWYEERYTVHAAEIDMEQERATLEQSQDWSRYEAVMVKATGYTAGVESTGKNSNHPQYGITYSGVRVKRDLYSTIAADLNIFPIGTVLFIPGYGYGVVADKGGAIKGKSLDLYYETVQDVYKQWGKKEVQVYVVKRGNGKLTEDELTKLNEDKTMQVFRQQFRKQS